MQQLFHAIYLVIDILEGFMIAMRISCQANSSKTFDARRSTPRHTSRHFLNLEEIACYSIGIDLDASIASVTDRLLEEHNVGWLCWAKPLTFHALFALNLTDWRWMLFAGLFSFDSLSSACFKSASSQACLD